MAAGEAEGANDDTEPEGEANVGDNEQTREDAAQPQAAGKQDSETIGTFLTRYALTHLERTLVARGVTTSTRALMLSHTDIWATDMENSDRVKLKQAIGAEKARQAQLLSSNAAETEAE